MKVVKYGVILQQNQDFVCTKIIQLDYVYIYLYVMILIYPWKFFVFNRFLLSLYFYVKNVSVMETANIPLIIHFAGVWFCWCHR